MLNINGRSGISRAGLRELAVVMHCLPHGRARLVLEDGRTLVVSGTHEPTGTCHPGVLSPCQFRRALSAVTAGIIEPGWVDAVATADLVSPQCRHLGAGLYAAWCAGVAIHAFTSELPTSVLQLAFEALPDPAPTISDGSGVRLVATPDLGLTLVTVESQTRMDTTAAAVRRFTRELQTLVLITELEMAMRASDAHPGAPPP
jgi:hypothetical protein